MYAIRYFITFVMTPIISSFYGIKISIYTKEHLPPHCHCEYAEYKLVINLDTLQIIEGRVPPRIFRRIIKWLLIEENRNMLLEKFHEKNPHLKL